MYPYLLYKAHWLLAPYCVVFIIFLWPNIKYNTILEFRNVEHKWNSSLHLTKWNEPTTMLLSLLYLVTWVLYEEVLKSKRHSFVFFAIGSAFRIMYDSCYRHIQRANVWYKMHKLEAEHIYMARLHKRRKLTKHHSIKCKEKEE